MPLYLIPSVCGHNACVIEKVCEINKSTCLPDCIRKIRLLRIKIRSLILLYISYLDSIPIMYTYMNRGIFT